MSSGRGFSRLLTWTRMWQRLVNVALSSLLCKRFIPFPLISGRLIMPSKLNLLLVLLLHQELLQSNDSTIYLVSMLISHSSVRLRQCLLSLFGREWSYYKCSLSRRQRNNSYSRNTNGRSRTNGLLLSLHPTVYNRSERQTHVHVCVR